MRGVRLFGYLHIDKGWSTFAGDLTAEGVESVLLQGVEKGLEGSMGAVQ